MDVEVVSLGNDGLLSPDRAGGETVSCKFILIAQDGKLYLVFGAVAVYPYHANLVGQFCQDKAITHDWVKRPDVVRIQDASYRILGGGHLEIDAARRKIKFSGSSKAYGYFRVEDVRLAASQSPLFAEFSVQIIS